MSRSSVLLKSTRLYTQMLRHGTKMSRGSQIAATVAFIRPVCAVQLRTNS